MPNLSSILRLGFSWFSAGARPRRLAIVFAAALAIGTAFVLAFPASIHLNVNTDYFTDYKPTAENILDGRGILGADGQLETRYPPSYPLFLVAAYRLGDLLHVDREQAIIACNLMVGAASSLLVYVTVELLFGASIALLTWLLWTTYIPCLVTMLHPNSEVPFMLFFFAAVWVFCLGTCREQISTKTGLFAGLLIGAAALVRPIAVFLPLVFMAALAFTDDKPVQKRKKERPKLVAAILLGFLLSIAPWELFVFERTGRFILLSSNGPATISEGLVFGLAPGSAGDQVNLSSHLRELMERANRERPGMRTHGSILRFVWNESVRNPRGVAELAVLKLRRAWYGMYSKRYEWLILALQLPYLLLAAAGIVLSFRIHREMRVQLMFVLGLVAYFWIMTCLVVPMVRYMVPVMAWMMLFVGLALHAAWEALHTGWHLRFDTFTNRPRERGVT